MEELLTIYDTSHYNFGFSRKILLLKVKNLIVKRWNQAEFDAEKFDKRRRINASKGSVKILPERRCFKK